MTMVMQMTCQAILIRSNQRPCIWLDKCQILYYYIIIIITRRIACTQCVLMRSIVADVAWSVCLLVTTMSCVKTAEPIEMQFKVDSGGPMIETCIRWDRVRIPSGKGTILGGGRSQ